MVGTRMRTAVILAMIGLALAGCGRRNAPVPPPGPDGQSRPSAVAVGTLAPGPGEATRNSAAPERRFVLDGLLN